MANATTAAPAAYCGWFKAIGSRQWRRLAGAATRGEALDALLRATARQSGDLLVLPAGEAPGGPRGQLRRGVRPGIPAGPHGRPV